MTKTIYPNIVRGGVAIPLNKRNYYYIKGRLHKDGGVDIGENPRTGLEVEGGEIVKMEQDGMKVFSAVPMLAGLSPAERVLRGENPDKVFAAQERFKDVNKINDDGSRKARLGMQDKNTKTDINPFAGFRKLIYGDTNNQMPIQSKSKFLGLKTHDGRGYNSDYIDYIYNSLSKSNLNKMQQAVILSHIINESGGDPFVVNKNSGKDYGLLQWVDRYTKTKETDPYKEIDNQLKYIYSTVNNLNDKVSWTHGGEGSGYQSLKDAYNDFTSDDLTAINNGFSLGYVRPSGKKDSAKNRLGLAQQIYDRIKQFGGETEENDKNNKVSKNYMYRHFPYVADRLEFPLYTSKERKTVQDDPTKAIEISPNVQVRGQMGERIIKRINNFDKNDSLVYHPLLNRLEDYMRTIYDKDDYTDQELDNINHASTMLYNLSFRKPNSYNKNHEFVNNILTKLSDNEISKLLNIKYYGEGASLIEGIKAKPKGVSLTDMWKLKNIMDKEYFNDNFIPKENKKQFGGNKPYTTKLNPKEEFEFRQWYKKLADKKGLNPNFDAEDHYYDYRGFWKNEDRDTILNDNSNAHFTDRYKKPGHPTFSNESIYSKGNTIGGNWVQDKNGNWLFNHSEYTKQYKNRTKDYLKGTGEGYIINGDTIIDKKQFGGNMKHKLIEVNIGGSSKLIRVPRPSSTGKSERSEDYNRKQAEYGDLKPILPKDIKLNIDDALKFTTDDIIKTIAKSYKPVTHPTVKVSTPQGELSGKTKFKVWANKNLNPKNNPSLYTDGISLLGNIAGSLISHSINKKMINSFKAPSAPVQEMARKSPTKYITNAIEEDIKDSLAEYERQVLGNTASSKVALARMNKGRNSAIKKLIEVHNYKENVETERLRRDIANQQGVAARNIERVNKHLADVNNFNNKVSEFKAENSIATTQNIIGGISDLLTRREKRDQFNKTLSAQTLANPNLPAEMFKEAGIWSEDMYKTYRKYNPLKQG